MPAESGAAGKRNLARWREPLTFLVHADKENRTYLPSYNWGDDLLSDRHSRIADAVWDVPGWLSREDAMKLYELAFLVTGPILEIGTYCGKSAITMATAISDAGRPGHIVSVDTDPGAVMLAHRYAKAHGVQHEIVFVCQSVERFLQAVPGFRPSLVFVDGEHSAEGVLADLNALAPCMLPGALLLLHDYLPPELPNASGFPVSAEPIEVRKAVSDSWLLQHADFAGTFGWSALFRISSTPSPTATDSHQS